MRKTTLILSTLIIAVAVFVYFTGSKVIKDKKVNWQSSVMPGKLSAAHAQFETNCNTCHTPVKGIDEGKCISCHANNTALLQRQPTAFHATIGNCASCHIEHQGVNANLRVMNHEALAKIGKKFMSNSKGSPDVTKMVMRGEHPLVSAREANLNCASCHSSKDKHQGLFGQNCASCHATTQWTIPEFQHPSVQSINCSQCHQAPPSHYLEHFEMISKKISGQENKNAIVTQCYSCHQTTAWNDIKGVGYYKHH